MVLLYILIFLILILSFVLITPLVFCIDSRNKLYYMQLTGIFRISVVVRDEWLFLEIKVPFHTFVLDPVKDIITGEKKQKKLKKKKEKEEKKAKEKEEGEVKEKKKRKVRPSVLIPAIKKFTGRFIRSFELKSLRLEADTGDPFLNAMLIPVFSAVNNENMELSVNFSRINSIYVLLENRLYRMVAVAVRLLFEIRKAFR